MTREDIIRMAREAAFDTYINLDSHLVGILLQRFATLVADHEREACAKVCQDDFGNGALNLADAIRARGQA